MSHNTGIIPPYMQQKIEEHKQKQKQVNVVVIFQMKSECKEHWSEISAALKDMQLHTRKEAGCIQYDFFESEAENEMILLEQWRSDEDLKEHMTYSYVGDNLAKIKPFVERMDMKKCKFAF